VEILHGVAPSGLSLFVGLRFQAAAWAVDTRLFGGYADATVDMMANCISRSESGATLSTRRHDLASVQLLQKSWRFPLPVRHPGGRIEMSPAA